MTYFSFHHKKGQFFLTFGYNRCERHPLCVSSSSSFHSFSSSFRVIVRKSGRSNVRSASTIKRIRCPDGRPFSRTLLRTALMTSLTTLTSPFWEVVKDTVQRRSKAHHPGKTIYKRLNIRWLQSCQFLHCKLFTVI